MQIGHVSSELVSNIVYILIVVLAVLTTIKKRKKKSKPNVTGGTGKVISSERKTSREVVHKHREENHTHDRYSENRIQQETPDEHYRHQINSFLQAGLIDKKEAKELWEKYQRSKTVI